MATALGILRIEPRVFWAMTVKELTAAFGCFGRVGVEGPPSRSALQTMMLRFPDQEAT